MHAVHLTIRMSVEMSPPFKPGASDPYQCPRSAWVPGSQRKQTQRHINGSVYTSLDGRAEQSPCATRNPALALTT
jgi:hypothetical protein